MTSASNTPTALLDEVEALLAALVSGEAVDADRVTELTNRSRHEASSLSIEQVTALLKAFDELSRQVRSSRDGLAEKLHGIGNKRRAVRGFGHLRGHYRGQRVCKKA